MKTETNSLSTTNSCLCCIIFTSINYNNTMSLLSYLQIRQQADTFIRSNLAICECGFVEFLSLHKNIILKILCHSYLSKPNCKLKWAADNIQQLTVSGDTAEVLLQLGHVKRGIQGFRVNLVIGECGGGEVGIRGVEAGRGDAAGYLQQSREEWSLYSHWKKHYCTLSSRCLPAELFWRLCCSF